MKTTFSELRIDADRLAADIAALGRIGRREGGGLCRPALGEAEREARAWLTGRLIDAELDVHVDPAGNIHGRLPGETPDARASVMTGSHLDTVPDGGPLDGAFGVVAGLECLRRLRESEAQLDWPLEVVAFTDEEGRFGGMLGSSAMAGRLTPEAVRAMTAADGERLTDALERVGLDPDAVCDARRDPETIRAFVELHIEQGPVLEHHGVPIGVVESIVGLGKWRLAWTGETNHSGTTPMSLRKDALKGAAALVLAADDILASVGSDRSVATVGKLEVSPGAPNAVPGAVQMSLEVRDPDAAVLDALGEAFRRRADAIAEERTLGLEMTRVSRIEPVACDHAVIDAVARAGERLGARTLRMPSGAAHDTQMMASVAPVGMVFVPSRGGRSHAPEEHTDPDALALGANVLLQSLCHLASAA